MGISEFTKKLYFSRRDLREMFSVTNYRIKAFIADGDLSEPVKQTGRAPFWTLRQVEALRRRLEEKANPKPIVINRQRRSRPLSQSHNEQIRRNIR